MPTFLVKTTATTTVTEVWRVEAESAEVAQLHFEHGQAINATIVSEQLGPVEERADREVQSIEPAPADGEEDEAE